MINHRSVSLALGLLIATSLHSRAQIIIGWAGPETGPAASLGDQSLNGTKQAIADLNAAGGILGQKVELDSEDDQGDPKQAVSVANRFVAAGIKFVVGHSHSANSIAASDVYADAGILEISPMSTNPKYTDRGLWNTFRTCGRDDQQAIVAGQYIAKNYKGKKIYIVYEKAVYGIGLADEVKKAINSNGVLEVGFEGITTGEKDFAAVVTKIKSMDADVVYYAGNYAEAGLLVRQMREQGDTALMIAGDGAFSSEFSAIAGPGGDGTLMTAGPDPRQNPDAKDIVDRMAANNITTEGFTLYAYSAVQVIAQAISAVGSDDPEKVAEKIKSGMTFNTVMGRINFDMKGDLTRLGYVIYSIKGGKFSQIE